MRGQQWVVSNISNSHQPVDEIAATRFLGRTRGTNLGPVGLDFGAACHQIDRADLMLADLHDRVRQGLASPEVAWLDTDGSRSSPWAAAILAAGLSA